jgi:hypothetical protein
MRKRAWVCRTDDEGRTRNLEPNVNTKGEARTQKRERLVLVLG